MEHCLAPLAHARDDPLPQAHQHLLFRWRGVVAPVHGGLLAARGAGAVLLQPARAALQVEHVAARQGHNVFVPDWLEANGAVGARPHQTLCEPGEINIPIACVCVCTCL